MNQPLPSHGLRILERIRSASTLGLAPELAVALVVLLGSARVNAEEDGRGQSERTAEARIAPDEENAALGDAALGDAALEDVASGDAALGDAALEDVASEDAALDDVALDDVAQDAARDVLNRETQVASGRAQRQRDAPGIVTVLTRDEIRRLAPRDLVDLLHLVPGFSFGTDVQGVIGPIVRGVWGQEGKVLVLWDGFEINETMYLAAPLENHFPLQAIERVEIIRGPGSALYGGYAQLAVINIVTRGADAQGVELAASYGHGMSASDPAQLAAGFMRGNVEVVSGHRIQGGVFDGLKLSLNVFAGEAARAQRDYTDALGTTFQTDWSTARMGPTWLSATATWGALQVKTLLDLFRAAQRDSYGESLDAPINNAFYGAHIDVKYTFKIGDLVEIEPRINIKRQLPWNSGGTLLEYIVHDELYAKTADRGRVFLLSRWHLAKGAVLTAGLDGYGDVATVQRSKSGDYDGTNGPFQNGEPTITYGNIAALAELSLLSDIANVNAGMRFEYHSAAGASFVPRFVVTRSFDNLWIKGLLSGAFKPPGIENLALNPELRPENATVYEAELGYVVSSGITLSASAYRIEVTRPIVYKYLEETDTETYANAGRTGAQGAEAELHMVDSWGALDASYSFTNSDGLSDVEALESGRRGVLRGVPSHKVSVAGRFSLSNTLSAGPTLVVLSERRGYLGGLDAGVGVEPPAVLASFALVSRDFLVDGLDATLALHNILDAPYRYLQPYDGGHAPLPAPGREVLVRLVYRTGS